MFQHLYYPGFLTLAIILTFILIPREKYKQYFIYGFVLGGLGDLAMKGLLSYLDLTWHTNGGIFQVGDFNLLSPLSWVPVTMLFLRFLPQRSVFMYLYIFGFSVIGVFHGYVVQNAGLYDFQPWFYPFGSLLKHLGIFSLFAWVFTKTADEETQLR